MSNLLHTRPAWYALGPLIGIVVVGLFATINARIGVLGGYSSLLERACVARASAGRHGSCSACSAARWRSGC